MKLYVNLFSLGKFLTFYSENRYLQKVLVHNDANVYIIDTTDEGEIKDVKNMLNSRGIKYKIK